MLKKILYGLLTLVGVAAALATVVYFRMLAKNRGPPPPVCALAPLQRRTFAAPEQISGAAAGQYNIEPAAALGPAGELVVAYNARTTVFGDSWIETVRLPASGPRPPAKRLAYDRSQSFDLWAAGGGDSPVRIVWLGHNGGMPEKDMEIAYSESKDGLEWSAPRAVHDVAHDCPPDKARGCMDKPMILASGDRVLVLYYSEAQEALRLTRSIDGGKTFTASVAVPNAGAYGDAALTPTGAIHVVSTTSPEGFAGRSDQWGDTHNIVEHAVSVDGSTFTRSMVSEAGQLIPFFFSNPQVEVDEARGAIYVVYPAGPELKWDIYLATSRDGGRTWSRIKVNDDAACASHMAPQAALDPKTGTLHVTWLENRSGSGGLAYAACEAGGARCSPNEAVSAPFASYSYARHSPQWLAEYGALFVDDTRRVLHSVWTQTVDEGGQPTARIFVARAALPP